MSDNSLLRNSSLFVAYMGCLGWGSAYFYGWGTSFYYGFPWWVVGAGVDDVARSLFYAVTIITIFCVGWGVGIVFFFSIKRKNKIRTLSFLRLFLAIILLFIPPVVEFSVIRKHLSLEILFYSTAAAFMIALAVRLFGHLFSVSCALEMSFIRNCFVEIVMVGFMIYFWAFSGIAGWYKPQLKKEYQMLHYDNGWYYVLARYDNRLILSDSFEADRKQFIIFNSEQSADFEISIVRPRL